MKNITLFSITLFLLVFLNACSQRQYNSRSYQQQTSVRAQQPNQYRTSAQTPKNIGRRTPARTRPQKHFSQQNSRVSQVPNISPARLQIVKIAHSTLGTPYKWGGNSPQRGFDCSGLMSYVHKNGIGMNIPRTTAQQRDRSRTISYAQLQPGDMLFFKTGKRTNHVGVYIGNRKFIHAPSTGKHVTVATMDSSYWHKRFVKFGTFL